MELLVTEYHRPTVLSVIFARCLASKAASIQKIYVVHRSACTDSGIKISGGKILKLPVITHSNIYQSSSCFGNDYK